MLINFQEGQIYHHLNRLADVQAGLRLCGSLSPKDIFSHLEAHMKLLLNLSFVGSAVAQWKSV